MTVGPAPFVTGDTVRLRRGKSPIRVMEVNFFYCADRSSIPYGLRPRGQNPRKGWYIRYIYLSSLRYDSADLHSKWRFAEDFTLFNTPEILMNNLFQTKEEKPRFGTFLIKDSKGRVVLEMKGSNGAVETFDKNDIEEVMPYTVKLRKFQGNDSAGGEHRHCEFLEGLLSVGDAVLQLSNSVIWEVTEIDTKERSPSKSKNGFFKLEGTRL